MYKSKYYTCEEIDERLLKGYYDDAVSIGYSRTFEQFKLELSSQDVVNLDILNNHTGYTSTEAVSKINELYPTISHPITFIFFDKTYNRERRFKYKGPGSGSNRIDYSDDSNYVFTLDELNSAEGAIDIKGLLYEIGYMGFSGRAVVMYRDAGDIDYYCGPLIIFSDSMGHVVNQILITNNILSDDGTTITSTHQHTRTFQYERFLVISQHEWQDREGNHIKPMTNSKWYPVMDEIQKAIKSNGDAIRSLSERVDRSVRFSELGSYFTSDEFMDCIRSGDMSVYGRWKVTYVCSGIDVVVGVVDVFVDSMLHCLTQRLLTNMVVNDSGELDGNTHKHSLHEYYRLYNLSWTEEKLPDGSSWPLNSWSAWKDDLSEVRSSIDELSSNLPTRIRLERGLSDVTLALANGVEDIGSDTIIEAATPTQAGVMSAQDKIDINNLKENVTKLAETDTEIKTSIEAETKRAQSAEQANAKAIADEVAERTKAVNELTNQLYEIYTIYGIEFDTAISSPTCTRIGRLDLHRTLPIQSKMRGCLLDDDGNVVKYLDPNDWTGEDRTGNSGQVMVEIPKHYRKFETEGTKRRVLISEMPFLGCEVVPKAYVSAYEATVERSTSKLCSVVNDDADYRGGNNQADWDETYRSLLGRPATYINSTNFRNYARNRKNGSTEWNFYTYDVHKTLFWLFVVEYATLNSQAEYNSKPTSEGYRQGGLGAGVTTWNWLDLGNFNEKCSFVPCGYTDSLGNRTGVVSYTAKNVTKGILYTTVTRNLKGL